MKIRQADGFALIDVLFVCGIIGILSGIAVPRLLLARQSANAASAIGTLRTISSSQLTYALTCGSGFYAPNLTTLGTKPPGSTESFISGDMGSADTIQKSGYVFQMAAAAFPGSPSTCNGLAAGTAGGGFRAGADSVEPTNVRFFAINASSAIYEDTSTLFAAMPESGPPPTGHILQ